MAGTADRGVPRAGPRVSRQPSRVKLQYDTPSRGFIAADLTEKSVTSFLRIVFTRSSLAESNVRADVGVTPGLPPCKPGVSVRLSATDAHDEKRNPQRDAEHDRERNSSRDVHFPAPLSAIDFRCNLRSSPRARLAAVSSSSRSSSRASPGPTGNTDFSVLQAATVG